MRIGKLFRHAFVARGSFHSFRLHRLIGHQQQRAGRNFIMETGDENRRGFHINADTTNFAQVLLKSIVVLPDAAISRVNRARPIVAFVIANRGGNRLLQTERRQRRNFRRIIIIRRALASNGCDGQHQTSEGRDVFDAPAFAEKQNGFRFNRREQIHDGSGARAAHAEIDNRYPVRCGVGHRTIQTTHRDPMPFGEEMNVIGKVDEQDVFAEFFNGCTGVARQPVGHDVRFRFHALPKVFHMETEQAQAETRKRCEAAQA